MAWLPNILFQSQN